MLQLFRDAALETDFVSTADDLTPEGARWLSATNTPLEKAAEARRPVEEDRLNDPSGTRPFQDATGKLSFHARTAIIRGRKAT